MDWYYDQLEQTVPLTQEKLDLLHVKHYDSGRPYQIGDIILYGFLKITQNNLDLITFHLEELNTVYNLTNEPDNISAFPILLKID